MMGREGIESWCVPKGILQRCGSDRGGQQGKEEGGGSWAMIRPSI